MRPTIGRIVHYALNEVDVKSINKRRQDAVDKARYEVQDGVQLHFGNEARVGDIVPVIVTRVSTHEIINGQALLDGNDVLWLVSVQIVPEDQDDNIGYWFWPPRE